MRGLYQTGQFRRGNQRHVLSPPAAHNEDFRVLYPPVQGRSEVAAQVGVRRLGRNRMPSPLLYGIPVRIVLLLGQISGRANLRKDAFPVGKQRIEPFGGSDSGWQNVPRSSGSCGLAGGDGVAADWQHEHRSATAKEAGGSIKSNRCCWLRGGGHWG